MLELNENNLPVSPMKKLKILSENQNLHNKNDSHPTKFEPNEDLKIKVPQFVASLSTLASTKTVNKDENNHELDSLDKDEPLLIESTGQYVIFPIKHDDMWHMYKQFVENFWSVTDSIEHLEALNFTQSELDFLKQVTAFFASFNSLGLVTENFAEDFSKVIQITEAKFFYGHQLFVQNIHFEMYNRLIEVLIKDETERNKFYESIESIEAVKAKRKWIKSWSENKYTFGEKLIASACLFGIMFTVINIVQDWFKLRSLKQALNHELIEIIDKMTVDFDLERDFACLMVHHLIRKPPIEFIKKTVDEAARVEKEFLLHALKVNLINVTENDIIKLVDHRSSLLKSRILKALDSKKHFNQEPNEETTKTPTTTTTTTTTTTPTATLPTSLSTPTIDKNIRFDEDF